MSLLFLDSFAKPIGIEHCERGKGKMIGILSWSSLFSLEVCKAESSHMFLFLIAAVPSSILKHLSVKLENHNHLCPNSWSLGNDQISRTATTLKKDDGKKRLPNGHIRAEQIAWRVSHKGFRIISHDSQELHCCKNLQKKNRSQPAAQTCIASKNAT